MATQYIYDNAGYLTGVCESGVPQPNSTRLPPIYTAGFTPQFVNGAWVDQSKLPTLTPMQFYLAFTPTERMAIKKSTDPVVVEFWATYQLAAQLNNTIDPNLVSVQEGLTYLATSTTATPPGAGILASTARIAQISQGIPQ